uniref:Uncharacterized protein n=1 Tax=Brassica campestris TaxID=3711 RepID=A0A3P5Y1T5_BRACM|nr:unnamed protein product [Brassica rapa]
MRFLFRLSQVSFNDLFDTEISCGPLYAIEYGTQFCFWLVKGYGGRCCYPCNTCGFHCVSWVPDLLFLKIGKRSLESKESVW